MEEFAWLFRLIPEGASVTAVLAAIMIFLKHIGQLTDRHVAQMGAMQTEHRTTINGLTVQFIEQLTEARETFGKELKEVTNLFSERHEKIENKIQDLHDGHVKSQGQTVTALMDLKEAVQRLEQKVK